ncbi:MAG: MlaE family lipid ABC transporter permease subunit [Alphaproteobacteria bacterium]|jgi:phospholipid/cholesterol/gamma-HCH transport system permease protein|nr:MlaE family lipid ABC transporter permease subunit [Alphaproteobacteria bacterium]
MASDTGWLRTSAEGDALTLQAGGSWTVECAAALDALVSGLRADGARRARFELSEVTALDSAGAWVLRRTAKSFEAEGLAIEFAGVAPPFEPLLRIVEEADRQPHEPLRVRFNPFFRLCDRVGYVLIDMVQETRLLVGFFGVTVVSLGAVLIRPRRLRFVSLVNQIEQTGLNAVPIVFLLNFLIGMVMAYLGVFQLRKFGAEIFTIDGLAFGIPREMAVLLTAIIVAGRSGSAFTAQIGTMQVNEEVDAIRTSGLDPVEVLVLPRINALLITLPMLTFLADVAGILGGALMTMGSLDLTFGQFMRRFEDVMTLSNFIVGMVKAPVFAYIIAIVGCFEGLRVSGSAESVGRMTTRSVVESITLVILAEAMFAIVFTVLGI